MTELLVGRTVQQALDVEAGFLALMQSRGEGQPDEDLLEDAVAFSGVSKYPARVKCALLGWMAFKDAALQAVAQSVEDQS
jgi:nitrogen fixation NifU-like protein